MTASVQHLPVNPLPAAPSSFMASAAEWFTSAGLLPEDMRSLALPFPVASELEAAMRAAGNLVLVP